MDALSSPPLWSYITPLQNLKHVFVLEDIITAGLLLSPLPQAEGGSFCLPVLGRSKMQFFCRRPIRSNAACTPVLGDSHLTTITHARID